MKKYSIIVPCYNEAKNIPLILKRFQTAIGKRSDTELILVNNGSVDDSDKVISANLPRFTFAKSIKVTKNIGYGHGVLTGLKEANGQFLGWTHADMQTDPVDVLKAFAILEGADKPDNIFIKGRRVGRPVFDRLFSLGMGVYASLKLRVRFYEINAQPTIFSKRFFNSWRNPPSDFSLDLFAYWQAQKNNLRIIRFPVLFPERKFGQSSWNTSWKKRIAMIKRSADFIKKLKERTKSELHRPPR